MAWGLGVDGRPAEGLQAPHRAPKALCGSCDARDGERIRSRGLSRPGWREIAGTLGQLQAGRQAGNGMACSRAKARLNWVSQGRIPGGNAEEMPLDGSVLSTVKIGGPKLTVGSTLFELWMGL